MHQITKYLELDKFLLATKNIVSKATIRKFSTNRLAPFNRRTKKRYFKPTVLLNGLRTIIGNNTHIYENRVWINGVSQEMLDLDLSIGDTINFKVQCVHYETNSLGNLQHIYLDSIADISIFKRTMKRRPFSDFLIMRIKEIGTKYEIIPMHWKYYIKITGCKNIN